MPTLNDPSLAKGGQYRVFVQWQGSSPKYAYEYVGCMSLDGPTQELGEDTPVYCPSPDQRETWDIVDATQSQPGLPTTDFTQHMNRYLQDFWWDLKRRKCYFNFVAVGGNCQRPDDLNEFDGKIIFKKFRLTNFTLGALNPLSGDDNAVVDITGSLQGREFNPFRPIQFGEIADATILSEVLDVTIADNIACGDCGEASDGCQKMYMLTSANSGSPGLSGQVVYSLDGGSTSGSVDITTLGGLSPNKFAVMGNKLVVVAEATSSHHYSLLSDINAGTSNWSEVSSGYVTGPRCIWVQNPARAFVGGAGGYIYEISNPTAAVTVVTDGSVTAQNINDIRGTGQLVVAVANNNAILVSENSGQTFALLTGPEPGVALNTVEILSQTSWWVGTANGNLYYTTNGGSTWVEGTPDNNITVINSVRFADEIVGVMTVQVGATARVYRTSDNGYSWHYQEPYIESFPTAERYNAVSICEGDYNTVLIGGRLSAGGDGIAAVGA